MVTKEADGAVALVGCVGLIPAVACGYVIRGWAIVTLWEWFAVPYFHAAPPGYSVAIGLSMLASMLCGRQETGSEKCKTVIGSIAAVYSKIFLPPVVTVCIGWMVHRWM